MNRGHARFESLEGAILLGEAGPEERAEFALHARDCALCCADAGEAALVETAALARDAETWRPSIERSVLARIREERTHRSRFAVGALGWAAACSIAVNVAFVTGLPAKIGNAFNVETPPASIASNPYVVRLQPQTFATIKRHTVPVAGSVLALHRVTHRRRAPAAGDLRVARSARPQPDTEVPDLFAGLDVRGSAAARSVAVETLPQP